MAVRDEAESGATARNQRGTESMRSVGPVRGPAVALRCWQILPMDDRTRPGEAHLRGNLIGRGPGGDAEQFGQDRE
jgi:hypothetical protein